MSVDRRYSRYFEGLEEGRIVMPRCALCGTVDWYPTGMCRNCRSQDLPWTTVQETPRLYSYTRVDHAFTAADRERVPFIVALVSFDDLEGVRLIAGLSLGEGDAIELDTELEPVFAGTASGETRRLIMRPKV